MSSRFFVLLLSLCVFTACQKEISGVLDTEPVTSTPAGKGTFTAKINGVAWTANRAAFANFTVASNGLPALLSIAGVGNDKKFLGMVLEDKGVNTYTFSDNRYNSGVFQDSALADVNSFSSHDVSTPPTGTVRVTKIDKGAKTVSGTFQFNVHRSLDGQTRSITDGVFNNVPYTEGLTASPAAAKDTFRVKVDGVAFEPYSITGLFTGLNNSISVQGSNQSVTKTVGLMFPAAIVPGTYTLDVFSTTHVATYLNGTTALSSLSGKLEILEHNKTTKRVRGNFSFKGETIPSSNNSAQLTEGYFSVVYK